MIFFVGKWLFSIIFSETRMTAAHAEIQILDGRAEFSLSGNDEFSLAFSGQKFLTGDRLRTSFGSRVSLELPGGDFIFLGNRSEIEFLKLEQKTSDVKIINIKLIRGRIWARVSENNFNKESGSVFSIETERAKLFTRGAIFDFSVGDGQDTIRLVKGGAEVEIADEELEERIVIGVGQKLVVNPENLKNLKNGSEVVEILDSSFIESEWHLKNLERFFPGEAIDIRRRIEILAPKFENSEKKSAETSIKSPTISSPEPGAKIGAEVDSVKIEGTAPENVFQIVVNGYTLTQFQPGDRKWSYFAAKKFGTLVSGENIFSVEAIYRDGKKSPPAKISIFYEGDSSPVAKKKKISIDDFVPPVVLKPIVADPAAGYETSADVVMIKGIVDPKTNIVKVNGFQLKQFHPGNTEFSYIANANYGNMKKGENIFKITAFGPDGKTATTEVKIFYRPISLGE